MKVRQTHKRLRSFRSRRRFRIRKGTEVRHAFYGPIVAYYFDTEGSPREFRGELTESGLWQEGFGWEGRYFERFLPFKRTRFWYYEDPE